LAYYRSDCFVHAGQNRPVNGGVYPGAVYLLKPGVKVPERYVDHLWEYWKHKTRLTIFGARVKTMK